MFFQLLLSLLNFCFVFVQRMWDREGRLEQETVESVSYKCLLLKKIDF